MARTGLPAAVLPIQFGRPLSDGSFVGDWFRFFLGQSKSPRRTRTAQGKHSQSPQTDHKSTKDCSGNAFPFCDLRPFNRRFNQLRSGETTGKGIYLEMTLKERISSTRRYYFVFIEVNLISIFLSLGYIIQYRENVITFLHKMSAMHVS